MKLPVCKPHFEPLCSISKITFCSVRRIFRFLLLSFFSDIRFLLRWLVFLLLLKCHKLFQMNCFDGFVLHLSTFDLGLFTLLNCLYSFAAAFRLAYRIIRCVFISFWIVHVFFLLSFVLSCQFHINNFFFTKHFLLRIFLHEIHPNQTKTWLNYSHRIQHTIVADECPLLLLPK